MNMVVNSLFSLPDAAACLLEEYPDARVFAFYGEMGAGKTTFIRELSKLLGCGNEVASPTFTLVNEYQCRSGMPVYHIDLYRIEDIGEAYDFGINEYLEGKYYCFIEWPEKIRQLLPAETVSVSIAVGRDGSRTFKTTDG